MDTFLFNIPWMAFNLALAIIPLIFMILFFQTKKKLLQGIFLFLWLLFLPNTIYVFTDLDHFIDQFPQVSALGKLLILGQYGALEIIGFFLFFLTLSPLEKIIKKQKHLKHLSLQILWFFNFLLGIALVVGKVERVHSSYIFTNPRIVIEGFTHIFASFSLFWLSILFGLFINCCYFLFRKPVMKYLFQSRLGSYFPFLKN